MDISILISGGAIFLPLIFACLLIIANLSGQYLNKKLINWGVSVFNLISLLTFVFLKMFYLFDKNISFFKEITLTEELKLNFGVLIDNNNIDLLIYSSLVYFLISIYSIIYFNKKKQYIFTKQRYYIFLALLSFNTYLFISGQSLMQSLFLWIIQGILIFIFSYFDIFKDYAKYNITRFYRIFSFGDILFLISVLILFKYAIFSQGYIQSTSLDYYELNELISYTYGIANPMEFILCALGFIIAIASRMFILPFSCFYSFIVNSSNILYISIITCASSILGYVLLLKTLPIFEFIPKSILCFKILLIFSIISSIIFLIFEKNTKIIFGYILSIINSVFIYLFLTYNKAQILLAYMILNIIILIIVCYLLYKDKTTIKKHFLIKQKGFILEKTHLLIFETIPNILSKILHFINDKITKNVILFILKIFNRILSLFVLKSLRNNNFRTFGNIFIIIALVVLLTIFIILFGEK